MPPVKHEQYENTDAEIKKEKQKQIARERGWAPAADTRAYLH